MDDYRGSAHGCNGGAFMVRNFILHGISRYHVIEDWIGVQRRRAGTTNDVFGFDFQFVTIILICDLIAHQRVNKIVKILHQLSWFLSSKQQGSKAGTERFHRRLTRSSSPVLFRLSWGFIAWGS